MPGQFTFSRKTFEQLEEWSRDTTASIEKIRGSYDALIRLCILTVKAEAQKRTMGPVAATRRSNPALAHRIPVQRITGRYFAGWTVRRLRWGAWVLYNEERAAYVVEFGIGQRARRPILKQSVLDMLRFIQTTRTAERFAEHIMLPRRDPIGRFRSFEQRTAGIKFAMTAPDLPGRGVRNPNLAGPSGRLPR